MKNKLITIEKSQLITDVEGNYDLLYNFLNPDLLIPSNLKGIGIGSLGALIQFIATWSRVSVNGKLLTYINDNSNIEKELNNLCKEFHGLVATQLVSKDRIFNRRKTQAIGETAKQISDEFLREYYEYSEKFRSNYRQRDKTIVLGCFDNTILEFPSYFYSTNNQRINKIKDSGQFVNLTETIFKILSTVELGEIKNHYRDSEGVLVNNLGIAIKELVDNTEAWGKKYFNSNANYLQNFRGLIAQFHTNLFYDQPKDPSEEFVNYVLEKNTERNSKENSNKKIGFCEISIIDNGAGFARMMAKKDFKDLTIFEEYLAVIECFKVNISSERNVNRGYGLTTMIQKIGKMGLLRIRTGRLCLYRNFFKENLDPNNEIIQKDVKFRDWTSRQTEQPTQLHIAEGTLITIIYPFDY